MTSSTTTSVLPGWSSIFIPAGSGARTATPLVGKRACFASTPAVACPSIAVTAKGVLGREAPQQDMWLPAVICFPHCIRWHTVRSAYPGGPSPCPGHYNQAFGSDAASGLPPVRWHVRAPCWARRCGSSLIPAEGVLAPRSCLLYAGWRTAAGCTACSRGAATTVPFWSWRPSQFRHVGSTTLTRRFLTSA